MIPIECRWRPRPTRSCRADTGGDQQPLRAEPSTVTGYLAFLAGLLDDDGAHAVAHATLERRVAAIGFVHALADVDSPTREPLVRDALGFWARQLGTAPGGQAKPLTTRLLRQTIQHLPPPHRQPLEAPMTSPSAPDLVEIEQAFLVPAPTPTRRVGLAENGSRDRLVEGQDDPNGPSE